MEISYYTENSSHTLCAAMWSQKCNSELDVLTEAHDALSVRRGLTHPVTVMFYTPKDRPAIRNSWP